MLSAKQGGIKYHFLVFSMTRAGIESWSPDHWRTLYSLDQWFCFGYFSFSNLQLSLQHTHTYLFTCIHIFTRVCVCIYIHAYSHIFTYISEYRADFYLSLFHSFLLALVYIYMYTKGNEVKRYIKFSPNIPPKCRRENIFWSSCSSYDNLSDEQSLYKYICPEGWDTWLPRMSGTFTNDMELNTLS